MGPDQVSNPLGHDPVNHPAHYTSHPSGLEQLEITRHLGFDLGNAIKYVWRTDLKNGLEDLHKARFYLADHMATYGTRLLWLPEEVQNKLALVEAAEVELHGQSHPRPCFFHFIARGQIDTADSELEALIQLTKEITA